MAGQERSRVDQIRDLIDQMERVRSDSERVTRYIDRSMKRPFWPDRRRSTRTPPPSGQPDGGDTDAA